MKSFDPFLLHLGTIRDPRHAEGNLYQLPYVLLFSILAIVTGANSYLGIRLGRQQTYRKSCPTSELLQ
jgi:hypothetical protein